MNAKSFSFAALLSLTALLPPGAYGSPAHQTEADLLGTLPFCMSAILKAPAKKSCSLDTQSGVRVCTVEGNCRKRDGALMYSRITIPDADVVNVHNCDGELQVGGC